MFCSSCGAEAVSSDARFCVACGASHASPGTSTIPRPPRPVDLGSLPPAGFYADPFDQRRLRWWSGRAWSEKTTDVGSARDRIRRGEPAPPDSPRLEVTPYPTDPGFYQDPAEEGQQRWWDGEAWDPIDVRASPSNSLSGSLPDRGYEHQSSSASLPSWAWWSVAVAVALVVSVGVAVVVSNRTPSPIAAVGTTSSTNVNTEVDLLCLDHNYFSLVATSSILGMSSTEGMQQLPGQAESLLQRNSPDASVNATVHEAATAFLVFWRALLELQNDPGFQSGLLGAQIEAMGFRCLRLEPDAERVHAGGAIGSEF